MLPVVRGEEETRRQILIYSFVLLAISLLPTLSGLCGIGYLAFALIVGAAFCALALRLWLRPDRIAALHLYLASLAYLALLFCAMAIDRII
jgi:heme o synthase